MIIKNKKLKLSKINKTNSLEDKYYELIDERIEEGMKEIEKGEVLTLEELRKEVENW